VNSCAIVAEIPSAGHGDILLTKRSVSWICAANESSNHTYGARNDIRLVCSSERGTFQSEFKSIKTADVIIYELMADKLTRRFHCRLNNGSVGTISFLVSDSTTGSQNSTLGCCSENRALALMDEAKRRTRRTTYLIGLGKSLHDSSLRTNRNIFEQFKQANTSVISEETETHLS
jgi:hypothetical protein